MRKYWVDKVGMLADLIIIKVYIAKKTSWRRSEATENISPRGSRQTFAATRRSRQAGQGCVPSPGRWRHGSGIGGGRVDSIAVPPYHPKIRRQRRCQQHRHRP